MSNFTSPPLLCEGYRQSNGLQSYTLAGCPYPSSLHRFTPADWASNTAGLHCSSNNDAACASDGNPLTKAVVNVVTQTIALSNTAASLVAQASGMAMCQQVVAAVQDVYTKQCHDTDLRLLLLITWVSLTACGTIGAALFLALLALVQSTMPVMFKAAIVNAVYGPGVPFMVIRGDTRCICQTLHSIPWKPKSTAGTDLLLCGLCSAALRYSATLQVIPCMTRLPLAMALETTTQEGFFWTKRSWIHTLQSLGSTASIATHMMAWTLG
jgi:hypothetical protein